MKYSEIEGLDKKDPFKKGFAQVLTKTAKSILKNRCKIIPQSIGEPASLIDFLDYDFALAFKTDGVGTKSLIADKMKLEIRKRKIKGISITALYSGLGIDVVATNVNDMVCIGATPIALSDEIAAGNYETFTDREVVDGIYKGLIKGCLDAQITIPSGESPTLIDIVDKNSLTITGSAIGIVKPKKSAILGDKLRDGDAIYGLLSSGIHTNGLSLARKIVEKLPKGYFTPFDKKTIGEELLTPTKIYVQTILALIKNNIDIHYMTHISGGAFTKIMRAKKPFTYIIDKLPPVPQVLTYLGKLGKLPNVELYKTWNMGLGFVIFAPPGQQEKIENIVTKTKCKLLELGHVERGSKKVIIRPINVTYEG